MAVKLLESFFFVTSIELSTNCQQLKVALITFVFQNRIAAKVQGLFLSFT